ncbi:MAG: hypothetical protein ACJ76N_21160 [Thermoanaerobaculia bacterium]
MRTASATALALLLLLPSAAVGGEPAPAPAPAAPAQPAAAQPPTSPIKILEADGSKIPLTTSHPVLDQRLFLTSQSKDPQKVTLAVSDLRSHEGRTARVALDPPGPLSFSPYQAQTVMLKGELADVGELTGVLTLTVKGVAQPFQYALTVKREKGAQQIEIDAQAEPPIPIYWLFHTSADVRLHLAETTGAAADFQWPELQSLVLNASDTYKPGARYTDARLYILGKDNTCLRSRILPAFGACRLLLRIEGLQTTGKYEGTVRVATPNGPQTKTFLLFVKDHWLFAALVILAGVWSSYWLRRWLQVGRPQALAEYQIGLLLQRVQIQIPDAADGVRQALQDALQELHRATLLDATTDIKPDLQKAGEQLENYLVIKSVLDLRPQLGRLMPDKDQRDAIKSRLDLLDQRIQDGKLRALTNEAGKNAWGDEARSIREELLKGAAQALEKALATLKTSLDAERAALAAGPLPDPDRTELTARLDQAAAPLETATQKLKDSRATTGQPAADLLQQGWQEYEAASRIYLAASGERFRRELAIQTMPPLGMEDTAWQTLQRDLLAALPANPTPEQYEKVRRLYLEAVLDALAKQAGQSAAKARQTPDGGPAATQLDDVAKQAAAARQRLVEGGEVATDSVTKLREAYEAAMALLPARKDLVREVALEAADVPPPAAPLPGAGPADLSPTPQLPMVRAPGVILQDVQSHDAIVAWIVCAVSVLVGLRVLWATSQTFGGLLDYIGAFLWGFGLHELNKLTMPEGLGKLGLALPQGKSGG